MQLKKFQRFDYGNALWGHDEGMRGAAAAVHGIHCLLFDGNRT